MRVNFDENEHIHQDSGNAMKEDTSAKDGEFITRPGGIIGNYISIDISE